MENKIIRGISFSEYEARVKLLVLSYSLQFEYFASSSLKLILNLDDQAISLGNSNWALSMNQKVQLMLDTQFFDKRDKTYIQTFVSIRNQFMHNAAARSFESCLSYLDGTETFIEKEYWNKRKEDEKAGREKAEKEKANEEIDNQELLSYNITDKERLFFKCWISLANNVIKSFEKVLNKISNERKVIKLGKNKSIFLNLPSED